MAKTYSISLGDPPVATIGIKNGAGWVTSTSTDSASLSGGDLRKIRDLIDTALADA